MNKKRYLGVDLDDIFKANNHVLSLESRANVMITRMFRNYISKEAKGVQKKFKIKILYSNLVSNVQT